MSTENTENKVQDELATERLERTITTLHEASAGVTAVNAEAIVLEAELQTIREVLVAAGMCTKGLYQALFANNVQEAVATLAESGMIDIAAVTDADDGAAGD